MKGFLQLSGKLLLIFGLVLSAGCHQQDAGIHEMEAGYYYDLSYGSHSSQSYDLLIPEGLKAGQEAPLLLFLHGGGWVSGDKGMSLQEAIRFCEEGYICAVMNYRLIQDDDSFIPEMMEDITLCLENAIARTSAMGIQLNEMAISGFSAGAHLALLYGLRYQEQSPLPIAFIFEKSGPVSMEPYAWVNSVYREYIDLFEGFRDSYPDFDALVSPLLSIDENSPPLIGMYSLQDQVIGTNHGILLENALRDYGIPHALYFLPASSHFMDGNLDVQEQYHEHVLKYARIYFHS